MEMSDDGQRRLKLSGAGERNHVTHVQVQAPRRADSPPLPAADSSHQLVNMLKSAKNVGHEGMHDKSDSEAETVVLSGVDEPQKRATAKAIKHEHVDHRSAVNGHYHGEPEARLGNKDKGGVERPSLKRKRAVQEPAAGHGAEGGISSNLSSTISSPAFEARSSKKSESGSDRSRSSPPYDEAGVLDHVRVRERKPGEDLDSPSRKQRGKSDPSSESGAAKPGRGPRSAHHGASVRGSESPPLHIHKRAMSLQSNSSETQLGNKRRKVPPYLNVDRRRKVSEDAHGESDDSSSIHDHSYLPKLASAGSHAISPAKMSHKKNRDKNGRTLLARACALDDVEAEMRLKERPQDLDIPDNAGNTPLQIASLEGKSKIVQLLLDAGCDITCKNTDMETPLIDAVENGHLDVVKMLLKAGLDPRQSNAKGEEPLDLVNPENDHYDAIRAALISAKEKDKNRRPSEDHNGPNPGGRDNDTSSMGVSAASPTESLPLPGAKSPPPALGARRRTARSQPTRDGLLWVNATPENLRDAAGKGDLTIVDHILKMRPRADSESVLAAARGGHEIVIELLIAIGRPDPDPDPLQSGDHKPAYSTPMLAAIGRGNVKVIQLLLNQPGFDPTRRLYRGMTYYEIAKERQSTDWEEEYKVLKEAYDSHMSHGTKKVNHGSPRKVRGKRPESQKTPADTHKTNSEISSSPPLSVDKTKNAESIVLEDSKSVKRESEQKTLHKHRSVPEVEHRDPHAAVSDRESETLGPPKSKVKNLRSVSDVGSGGLKTSGSFKPRRKLLSRNDLESDQDTRRRATLTRSETVPNADKARKSSGDSSGHLSKARKEASNESAINSETGRKRMRISISPRASLGEFAEPPDTIKKKKRRRVDSEDNMIQHDEEPPFNQARAMVANMVSDPKSEPFPKNPPSAAPVAFMGGSGPSPVFKSPISPVTFPSTASATAVPSMNAVDKPRQTNIQQEGSKEQKVSVMNTLRQPSTDHTHGEDPPREPQPNGPLEQVELRGRAEAENPRRGLSFEEEAEEASRLAREKEALQLEAQLRAEEAERQRQIERDEEEARVAKKQMEEELELARMEQERIRNEEQERKRAELDEQERQHKIRIQEDEEGQRRESLPNGLRRAAALERDEARSWKETQKWLPLYTATTSQLDPTCEDKVAADRWISNIQVAPILAITHLDLPQCTHIIT